MATSKVTEQPLAAATLLLATLTLTWLFPSPCPAQPESVQPRVLILAQQPVREARLRALRTIAGEAGVALEYRYLDEALQQGQHVPVPSGVDFLIIDSPYASRLSTARVALEKQLKASGKPVLFMARRGHQPAYHLEPEDARRLEAYYQNGGKRNARRFFHYVRALLGHGDANAIAPPIVLPDAGIYHPDHEEIFPDLAAFLRWRGAGADGRRPVVGVAIHRSWLVDGLTTHIDATVRALEAAGAVALVYYHPVRDRSSPKTLLSHDGKTFPQVILSFRAVFDAARDQEVFADLDIPVIQALVHKQSARQWRQDASGWPANRLPFYIVQPEAAGIIDPLVVATTEESGVEILPAQLDALVNKALRLAALRTLPNRQKNVALFYYNSPPGGPHLKASFLNVPQSLENMLAVLKGAGYRTDTPEAEVIAQKARQLLQGLRNPRLSPNLIAEGLAAALPLEDYVEWFDKLPAEVRRPITDHWGEPRQSRYLHRTDAGTVFVIPRLSLGNAVLLPQPLRGRPEDDAAALQHDRKRPLSHHYLATYLWVRTVFGAHAIIHLGTHGTLEWTPGKERGLSVFDAPLLALGDLPVVYPYIVDDAGEALQAKRRGRALIVTHQPPPFEPAGLYGELTELHRLIRRYESLSQGAVKEETARAILGRSLDIAVDLKWTAADAQADFPAYLEALHAYLHELSESRMPLGLHSFGQAPKAEHITSTVLQMLGSDYLEAVGDDPEVLTGDDQGLRNSRGFRLLHRYLNGTDHGTPGDERLLALLERGKSLARRLRARFEMKGLLAALEGRFVAAKPGGDPLRDPSVLPTGGNLYGFDPQRVPTKEAWSVGQSMLDELIKDYHGRHGRWPDKLAFSLWSSELIRHHGVIESQVLYALGVRPVWDDGGKVIDVEIVSRQALGRPRVDVVISATGLYRDTFEGTMRLIAKAVDKVAALEEPDNPVHAHSRAFAERLRSSGVDAALAETLSRIRVFTPDRGAYGTGLPDRVLASVSWNSEKELAEIYLRRMQYGWGPQGALSSAVAEEHGLFAGMLSGTDIALLARSSNLYGLLSSDDPYQNLGGLALAVRQLDGHSPELQIANLRKRDNSRFETLDRFLARELRVRPLNPRWIRALQAEGYAGTVELLDTFQNLWGWEVTAPGSVRNDQWQAMAEVYVRDKHQLGLDSWFERHNPQSQAQIIERLLEAARKGRWQPDTTMQRLLVRRYRELQGLGNIDSRNERFQQYLDRLASGFGLAAAKPQAREGALLPPASHAAAQPVTGQRLEKSRSTANKSSMEALAWLVLLIGVVVLGYLTGWRRLLEKPA